MADTRGERRLRLCGLAVLAVVAGALFVVPATSWAARAFDPEVMAARQILHRRAPLDAEARRAVVDLLRHPDTPHLRALGACCVLVHREQALRAELVDWSERTLGREFQDLARTAVMLLDRADGALPYLAQENAQLLAWMPAESIATPQVRSLSQAGIMYDCLRADFRRFERGLTQSMRKACRVRLERLAPSYEAWESQQWARRDAWRGRSRELGLGFYLVRGALLLTFLAGLGAGVARHLGRRRVSRVLGSLSAGAFVLLVLYLMVGGRLERPDPEPAMPPIGLIAGTPVGGQA